MAARNLSIVAGRILKLLGSEKDIEEIGSSWGVPNELLQGVKETISQLAPLLLDAEKKSDVEHFVESWLMELEDVIYDADNLLDELSTEAMKRRWIMTGNKMANQVRSYFFSSSRLKNMCQGLNIVRERLDEIAAWGRDLILRELNEKQVMKLDKNPVVVEEVPFMNKDKLRIIKTLLDDRDRFKQNFNVLPIVVEEGMGKTTIAKDVFNDQRVQNHFDIGIWINISDNFQHGQIVKAIFGRAIGVYNQEVDNLSFDQLHMHLRSILKEKLFLIVLDDVWAEDCLKWDSIKEIFTVGANGSKVILTTRSTIVASITGTREPYYLSILTEEQSWFLFEKMAFGQEQKSSYKVHMGKEIVKKCYRVPVVMKIIAGTLCLESRETEWQFFYENELSGIWSANNNLLPLLKRCYDHLPSPLKHCFAYCSLFPKGHKYDVQTLIKLWMAQGFIIDQPGKSLEDVGYEYVLDLLKRSFFEEAEIDVRERVTIFQIHDLVHDLAISVAGHQCRMVDFYSPINIHGRPSHVSIDFDSLSAEDIQLLHAEKMRSIVLLGRSQWKYESKLGNQIFEIIVCRFRFLRALDMHALGIKTVPHSIGKLKLLKYLDLSENEDITELPNSITKLLNLQTLRLSSCFRLKEFPKDFKNLVNLRHLEIDGCYNLTSLPRGISQLPNLQILSQLVVSEEATPNIGLNALSKEVHIKNLGHGKFDMDKYLNVVSEVRSLSLEWESHAPESDEHKAPLNSDMLLALEELTLHGFRGNSLFSSGCPSNLVKLSLIRCVHCQILPSLNQLPNLKVLVLDEITKLEYISDNIASSTATFFPSLQELWLTELPELQGWWRNGVNKLLPSFPCLSQLVIEDCPKLASMPLFPTLEKGLVLDTTCWKPFQLTLDQKAASQDAPSSSSSSPSPPLSKLKCLRIVGVEDCKADEVNWETLKSLQFLRFDCLPNLVTLPEGLQQVTSLQELHLWRCGIEEIPEWIGKIKNLEKLVIRICPRLKSLPKAINELPLLETLEIEECDILLRRCEKDIGADWEKISSISKPLLGRIYGK